MEESIFQMPDDSFRAALRAAVESPPDVVRKNLLQAVRAAECAPEIREGLTAWAERCTEILGLIAAAVQKYRETLSETAVFSDSGQGGYHPSRCTLMRELENGSLALRQAMLFFSPVQTCFSVRQPKILFAEQLCRAAAHRYPELLETAEQALADLKREQTSAQLALTQGAQCREKLELYIRAQLPALCSRLERNPEKAEPAAGELTVCGAFCHHTEHLVSVCRDLCAELRA